MGSSVVSEHARDAGLRRLAVTPDDPHWSREELLGRVEMALKQGISGIVLREKRLADEDFVALGLELREVCRQREATFVLNEREALIPVLRPDVFQATFRSAPLSDIRSRAAAAGSAELPVGISVHDLGEGIEREEEGFDFLVFGPIYDTPSKRGRFEPRGLEALAHLAAAVAVPVVAIGGVRRDRESELMATGASGVAMMRAAFASREQLEGGQK